MNCFFCRSRWRTVCCLMVLMRCGGVAAESPASDAAAKVVSATDSELRALVDEVWDWELQEDPLLATEVGDPRGQDRLPTESSALLEGRAEQRGKFSDRLLAIDREALSDSARADYEVLRRRLADAIAEHRFGTALMPLTSRSGFHVFLPDLAQSMRLETGQDYRNYVARLKDFPRYFDEQTALLRAGIARGLTPPAILLRDIDQQLESQVVPSHAQSVLYKPFQQTRPAAIPEEAWRDLCGEAALAIEQAVVPAFRDLLTFMRGEYLPACRGSIAAGALPEGREFYRYRVRHFTTLELTPEEVHEIGLREVTRIRGEMEACMRKTGFVGTWEAFVQQLRTDPRHYAKTPEELLQYTALICKRIDGALPRLFSRLPRTPYGLREIPAFVAPQTTTAYYWPPAGDGSRAGYFYLNTYNLSSRPKYEMEALAMHEAVPGHHLQIALQQELQDLHPIRRFSSFTAFVEGWGLYAERLGLEMGFYEDPYQDFGRLSMEAWRACRLVVDTGMHALGWSREQAIEFMVANTALAEHNVVAEVDRYIGWPGQALGYKIGQLKILELRQRAEMRLAGQFDIREFHDVVLSQGSIPLELLEANVDRWIARMAAP
jgi:uncharacterized protein (DUF885 family)